ncbi:hypothetical protein BZA70DRAFT_271196 [Myxozyma melibiosi]|uniref:HIG1 domain-containing protein n=1 Tax=Myxozyma melibiosi TaxID=54550 RepID=A0ABR1FC32_9ASCO
MSTIEEIEKSKDGLWPYVLKRALPAGIATGSVGIAINKYLVTRFPAAAQRNASARSFMMLGSFMMGFVTTTEIYSLKYERMISLKINDMLDGKDKKEGISLDEREKVELPPTVTDKALTYLNENRFKAFLAVWLGSLGAAGYAVSRDKIMTTTQKVVQARMYAQGFTLLLIVGSAGLSMLESPAEKKDTAHKHIYEEESWKKALSHQPSDISK